MPRVALVHPHFRTHAATELLFPPLGAASLASQLERLGVEVRVFDGTFSAFADLERCVLEYQPNIVGVYSMITMSRNALRMAQAVRSGLPEATLIAGGPLPTLYPEQYSNTFDLVFRGEVDLSFPGFCRDLLDLGGTPGSNCGHAARRLRWAVPAAGWSATRQSDRASPGERVGDVSATSPRGLRPRRVSESMVGSRRDQDHVHHHHARMLFQLRFLLTADLRQPVPPPQPGFGVCGDRAGARPWLRHTVDRGRQLHIGSALSQGVLPANRNQRNALELPFACDRDNGRAGDVDESIRLPPRVPWPRNRRSGDPAPDEEAGQHRARSECG